jgi:formate hydrogenlyase subunit 6/NADH:ubiquinone oxidoreductase subunit I
VKLLSTDQLTLFFASLEKEWEVRLPVRLPDGTRALGTLADGPPALFGGALPAKPTAAFFPQDGPVFTATGREVRPPPAPVRPLFVTGFTARDLACLRFIDRFFADSPRDDLYFRRRQGALIAGVSGRCGPGGSLVPIAGGGCDLELIREERGWMIVAYSDAGRAVAAGLSADDAAVSLKRLRQEMELLPDDPERLLLQGAELLRGGRVPDSFWAEIGDRCIACTGCNLVCPTCTCFGVQDWRSAAHVERSRMWDSCQLEGFMREASGHNPLGSEALRTRRRIHHKLAADLERWGEISCFLCGRCDAVCPTGIGIVAVTREMVERFGRE